MAEPRTSNGGIVNIPIVHSVDSLERFIEHIKEAPTPRRVTVEYLKRAGFKTGNDPELRHIFRLLGFLSDKDVPLKRWKLYKTEGRKVLRASVEECYNELFKLFPDATARTDDELKTWFRPPIISDSRTSAIRAIRTFRYLCSVARIPTANKKNVSASNASTEKILPSQPSQALEPEIQVKAEKPLVFQLPPSRSKAEYKQMLEAFKEVFYS